jgi:hypothetical protein
MPFDFFRSLFSHAGEATLFDLSSRAERPLVFSGPCFSGRVDAPSRDLLFPVFQHPVQPKSALAVFNSIDAPERR